MSNPLIFFVSDKWQEFSTMTSPLFKELFLYLPLFYNFYLRTTLFYLDFAKFICVFPLKSY